MAMTRSELNAKLKAGIVQDATQEKSLPEDIADTFVNWVHSLIGAAQKHQAEIAVKKQMEQGADTGEMPEAQGV